MSAIPANVRHHAAHRAQANHPKRRRRAILAAVGATFLGLYVLGISWFANELGTDMQRSLQVAPAAQDVAHR